MPSHGLGIVRALRDSAALDALEREREAAPLGVDLDDLRLDEIALRDDLARVLDVVLRQLGDVHEPLDPGHDLDERAEGDDLRDLALDVVALVVGLEHLLPRIGLRLLEPERDALAVAVDVEHLDLDVWPISSTSDGWLTCDQESSEMWIRPSIPSRSTKAPKSTMFEIWPSTTSPGLSRSRIAWRMLLALVLEDGAAREHDVVARAVELDHLAAQLLAEELVEVLDAADVDERRGQEAAHAEVEDQAALDDLDHLAVDGLAATRPRSRSPSRPSRSGRASWRGSGGPRRPPS